MSKLSEDIFEYAEATREPFDAGQPTGFDSWADRAAALEAENERLHAEIDASLGYGSAMLTEKTALKARIAEVHEAALHAAWVCRDATAEVYYDNLLAILALEVDT